MTQSPHSGQMRSRLDFLRTIFPGYQAGVFVTGVIAVHFVAAWFNGGFLHSDEHYQIIEFAQYKLGHQPASALAWEFPARMRPALQPWIAAGIIRLGHAIGIASPFLIALALRVLSTLLALWASWELCQRCLRRIDARWIKAIALGVSFLFWLTPTAHGRFGSENWGGALFVGGVCLMLDAAEAWPVRHANAAVLAVCTGLVWSAAFYCRFQIGASIAGGALWLWVVRRAPGGLIAAIGAAFVVGCGLNEILDHWLYDAWTLVPYNYFMVNLVHGKAATFGVSPWWMPAVYLAVLLIPPFSLGVLVLLATGCWYARHHVIVWVTVPFVLLHAVVAHKEPRFLLPLLYLIGPLLAVCVDALPRGGVASLVAWLRTRWGRATVVTWGAVNVLLLSVAIGVPANDTYWLDRWLWEQSRHRPMTVYTIGGSPYDLTETTTNSFYRSERVVLKPVEAADQVVAARGQEQVVLYYRGDDRPAFVTAAGACARQLIAFPEWLVRLDTFTRLELVHQSTICTVGSLK
jgi:phosphatidylinositol glycan class B